jgi:outer membrane protein assembly factor BamE
MRIITIFLTAILFMGISLSACSVYKIDVQQGNVLDKEAVDKLKLGMTKQQVLFVLGSPIIKDAFRSDRWDYVHTFRPGKGEMVQRAITVFFKKGKLVKIDDSDKKAKSETKSTKS